MSSCPTTRVVSGRCPSSPAEIHWRCSARAAGGAPRSSATCGGCASSRRSSRWPTPASWSSASIRPRFSRPFAPGWARASPSSPTPSAAGSTGSTCSSTPTRCTTPTGPPRFTLFPDLTVHRRYKGYWYLGRADPRGAAARHARDLAGDPARLGARLMRGPVGADRLRRRAAGQRTATDPAGACRSTPAA